MNDDEKKRQSVATQKQKLAEKRSARGLGVGRPKSGGSGPVNSHGMPKLPPGQHAVKNWPVLDLGIHPTIDKDTWSLEIDGLVDRPKIFTWDAVMALPQKQDVSDFHCVTTWSRFDNNWEGILLRDILELCGIRPEAQHIYFEAYDEYSTNITLQEGLKPDVLLVHTWQGQPLPKEHGGPLRVITPQLYAWKGAKWVKKITLLAEDRKGFWEDRGYSNSALPWVDDRYSNGKPPSAD